MIRRNLKIMWMVKRIETLHQEKDIKDKQERLSANYKFLHNR